MVRQSGVDNEQLTQKTCRAIPATDQRTGSTGQNGERFGSEWLGESVRSEGWGNDHAVVESQLDHYVP